MADNNGSSKTSPELPKSKESTQTTIQVNNGVHSDKEAKPSKNHVPSESAHAAVENTNTVITGHSSSSNPLNITSTPTPVTPKPLSRVGNWSVTDKDGNVCILLSGALSIIWVNETVSLMNYQNLHDFCIEEFCSEIDIIPFRLERYNY